ncbi:MAG TPA: DUF3667 domain-containing protein [Bacteroidetes bacterium]|nr:DUF3667 domain-containing protein [Bacteroidota bacterium]
MENKPTQTCRNCGHPLPEGAKFCPACSQKNSDGRLTFGELGRQFLSNFLDLDNRIFKTLGALAVPGKLTSEYFKGKHIRFYHPVRLFLFSVAVLIAAITININKAGLDGIDIMAKKAERAHYKKELYHRLDSVITDVKTIYPETIVATAFDSLVYRFGGKKGLAVSDSIEITGAFEFGGSSAKERHFIKVPLEELAEMSENELWEKYHVEEGIWNKMMFSQNIRVMKNTKNFVFYLLGNIIWMVLIMMPMLALALKLLYIRRPYFYYEHLLFSFHTHTFIFILYALILILQILTKTEDVQFLGFAVPVYLYMSMKRFYGQGWIKTIVKFLLASFMYVFIFAGAMMLTTLASVFLF